MLALSPSGAIQGQFLFLLYGGEVTTHKVTTTGYKLIVLDICNLFHVSGANKAPTLNSNLEHETSTTIEKWQNFKSFIRFGS